MKGGPLIRKPVCTCGSDFRSPTDILMSAKMGMLVEDWHAMMDLWEETLEEVMDVTHNMSDVEYFAYLKSLREEYGLDPKSGGADQEDR
jgi:hypothetical protein